MRVVTPPDLPDAPIEATPGRLRLGAVVLGILVLGVVADRMGGRAYLGPTHIRAMVLGAGAFGLLAFVGVFVLGELLHLPGLLLVAIAMTIWGRPLGMLVGWVSSLLSIAVCFLLVRWLGGAPPRSDDRSSSSDV